MVSPRTHTPEMSARRFGEILEDYQIALGLDPEDILEDHITSILVDLLHYCAMHGPLVDKLLQSAKDIVHAESDDAREFITR